MAVPKRKMSKARRDSRRANWKLTAPGFVSCPQCHEPKMPHRVCPSVATTMAERSLLRTSKKFGVSRM